MKKRIKFFGSLGVLSEASLRTGTFFMVPTVLVFRVLTPYQERGIACEFRFMTFAAMFCVCVIGKTE
jgi:hypothetical protein